VESIEGFHEPANSLTVVTCHVSSLRMQPHWLDLLHILDSSFPSGAYVHSAGLESIAGGREALESLLRLRIEQSLARLELVFVLNAYAQDLVDLDQRYHALQLVREPREASAAIGTSFLRSVSDLVPDVRVGHFLRAATYRHHPIAFGAVAAALDVSPALAAEAFAFGSVRAQVAAAQRLGWIGQREAQQVLHHLKPDLVAAVATAWEIDVEDAGAFAPAWDIACMAHERADVRMFAS
jgi:urease accessory protein